MKIRLLKDARIKHYAGETVEVSPAEAAFLLSVNAAIAAKTSSPAQKKATTKKEK